MARKTYPDNYNYGTGAQSYYHMKGVDALPRVSAAQMRANGYDNTTRFFDEKTNTWITPAQQQAKTGVLPKRIGSKAEVGKLIQQAMMDKTKAAARIKGPSVKQVKDAAAKHRTLHITTPSSCFDSVSCEKVIGVVSVAFHNGYFYDADLDLDTMIEWASDPSLGSFFNHVLGQDYFAAD